ncbi:hypothetical protein CSPX01_16267 [Colletotrichum filicis]|nr:hypothetical protein CSPX01_16267 [Colletotrichum filicis]
MDVHTLEEGEVHHRLFSFLRRIFRSDVLEKLLNDGFIELNEHLLDRGGKVAFRTAIEDEGLAVVDTKGDKFFLPVQERHVKLSWDDARRAKAMIEIIKALFGDSTSLAMPENISPATKKRIKRLLGFGAQYRTRTSLLAQDQSVEGSSSQQNQRKRSTSELDEDYWKAVEEYQSGALNCQDAASKYGVSPRTLYRFTPRPDAEDLYRRRLLAAKDVQSGLSAHAASKRHNVLRQDLSWFKLKKLNGPEGVNMEAAVAAVLSDTMSVLEASKHYGIVRYRLITRIPPFLKWKKDLEKARRAKKAAEDVEKGVLSLWRACEVYKVNQHVVQSHLTTTTTPGQAEADDNDRQKRIKLAVSDFEAGRLSLQDCLEKYNVGRKSMYYHSSLPRWSRPKPNTGSGPSGSGDD